MRRLPYRRLSERQVAWEVFSLATKKRSRENFHGNVFFDFAKSLELATESVGRGRAFFFEFVN